MERKTHLVRPKVRGARLAEPWGIGWMVYDASDPTDNGRYYPDWQFNREFEPVCKEGHA